MNIVLCYSHLHNIKLNSKKLITVKTSWALTIHARSHIKHFLYIILFNLSFLALIFKKYPQHR